MSTAGSKRLLALAKQARTDIAILQAEVNSVLKMLATDDAYAARLYNAIDENNRKEVILLLKKGGIKKTRIAGLELFPGNLKVKLTVDFKRMMFSIEIDTSDK